MALRTNYKDDVFSGKRKYKELDNGDGTVSFDDETEYAQTGDSYGAAQINEANNIINNLDLKCYKNTDSAETSITDNDYFPFYDSSASAPKKTLFSNLKNVLTNFFAIKTHSSTSTTYGTGSSSLFGHVKLSDNYTSSAGPADSGIAASSKAVYDSYTANKNSITTLSGTVSNINTQVNTNKNNITGLTARMTAVENKADTNATGISGLKTRMTSAETKITTIEGELTANNKRIYMDYKNGRYGINTSANRGADSFVPFNSGEYTVVTQGVYNSDNGDMYSSKKGDLLILTGDFSAFTCTGVEELLTLWYVQRINAGSGETNSLRIYRTISDGQISFSGGVQGVQGKYAVALLRSE